MKTKNLFKCLYQINDVLFYLYFASIEINAGGICVKQIKTGQCVSTYYNQYPELCSHHANEFFREYTDNNLLIFRHNDNDSLSFDVLLSNLCKILIKEIEHDKFVSNNDFIEYSKEELNNISFLEFAHQKLDRFIIE